MRSKIVTDNTILEKGKCFNIFGPKISYEEGWDIT
jgi:hypothetical protein